jgi:drug/metabolite transporter (DMT)-like permease
MIYLLLTILANVSIFMAFRSFGKYNINNFPAIITNYLVCVITGSIYAGPQKVISGVSTDEPWFYSSFLIGVVFVSTFYLMAKTTQLRGVATATVASKMSLAIPVVFSLFIFKIGANSLDLWNYLGIILAFVAIILVTKRKSTVSNDQVLSFKFFILPFSIFLLGGLIDTSLNYVNHKWLTEDSSAIFTIMVFGFAFVIGFIVILVKKIKFRTKDVLAGIALGIPNFFSIFFQLKALSAFDNNGALLYPSLNIGIIIGSTLAAILFFKEHLSKVNKIGISIAILAILLLSHQAVINYFTN